MDTKVVQIYTPFKNLSVTTRDGRIDKVTVWTTGESFSTEVIAEVPAEFRSERRRRTLGE